MKIRTALARIKRKILAKPFAKNKRYQAYWFDRVLRSEDAFVVQIGSNDGKTGDPLYALLQKYSKWQGLFVEPLPDSFQKLQQNYPDKKRFRCENVAINEGRKMTFYWVDPKAKEQLPDLPYWYDQLGSFDRSHIVKQLDGVLEPFIRTTDLEGISLPDLLQRNAVEKISILHIDAEGYDWKILSQLNLDRYQPTFILYEYHHLSKEELSASYDFLDTDYWLFDVGIDVLAVHKKVGSELGAEMQREMKAVTRK
ncbi:MAG: FkbM family methyltransferase [Bacteroidota bacterium]